MDATSSPVVGANLSIPSSSPSCSDELVGIPSIMRYLGRAAVAAAPAGSAATVLYPLEPLPASLVDAWLDYCPSLVPGAGLEAACAAVDNFLAPRSYLVGYGLTLADVAVWGQLAATPQWTRLRKARMLPHLARWFDLVASLPEFRAVIEQYGLLMGHKQAGTDSTGPVKAKKGGGELGCGTVRWHWRRRW